MFTGKTFGLRTIQFAIVALLLAIPLTALAQVTSGTIVGTVTDPGGASVPGAQVMARSLDTGLTRTVTSSDAGTYRIEFLPVGKYSVEVTYTGFKKALVSDIVLQVNDTARVDVALNVGQVSETVTISEMATPAVNTSTSEIARTIQSAEITSLPLVERNVYTLLDLTPGVQSNNNGIAAASTGTSTFILGYPEQRTLINGGTDGGTGSVNYYLDGGINMTNLRNTGNILPNPDAIQEFRVQTNSYNAEYGRYASGVINVLTKSGTNQFHGSAFEFLRNTVFNANDWGSTLARAPFHRNQFGATLGGPIKHDKAFFFFSYSGLRQTTSSFLSGAVVPTALERIGNFTASGTKPVDPKNGLAFVCNGVTNVICPDRLDKVAVKIINDFIPLSNVTGNKWQGNVATPYNFDEYLGKVDYQLSAAHHLNFSYFNTGGTSTTKAGSPNVPWSLQDSTWRQHSVNASDVWILSAAKINQVWLTFSRNFGGRINVPATSLTDLGSAFVIQGTPNLPQITVTGYFTLGQQIGGPIAGTNFYSARDVFSWIKGSHSLKLGGEISLNKDIQQTLLNNYGVFTFNAGATARVAAPPVTAAAGNAFADFLIGIPSAVSQDAPVTGYTNSWYTALFVQDDFKVRPRLTLNLGLRWDVQTAPTDPQNRVVNYVPGQKSVVIPSAPVGALFFGDPGVERGGIPTSFSHFSPRLGFAWDVFGDGKTSIRGAWGLFYGSLSGNEWNT